MLVSSPKRNLPQRKNNCWDCNCKTGTHTRPGFIVPKEIDTCKLLCGSGRTLWQARLHSDARFIRRIMPKERGWYGVTREGAYAAPREDLALAHKKRTANKMPPVVGE